MSKLKKDATDTNKMTRGMRDSEKDRTHAPSFYI